MSRYLETDFPFSQEGSFSLVCITPSMRLLLIPALLFLFHTCVLGDWVWTFPSKVPGWSDLRSCLRDCFGSICDPDTCPSSPIAMSLGCATVSCICQADFRNDALNFITNCVKDKCDTTDEPTKAVDIFNTYCGGAIPSSSGGAVPSSSVSSGPDATVTQL